MTFSQKTRYINIVILFSVFIVLGACAPKGKEEPLPNPSLRIDKLSPDSLGIIGDYDFNTQPPDFLNVAWQASGFVTVVDDKDESVYWTGNGLAVTLESKDKTFILTAKHIVYDEKTKKRKGLRFFFGHKQDASDVSYIVLNTIPEYAESMEKKDDFILIPFDDPNIPTFPIPKDFRDWNTYEQVDGFAPESLFSISTYSDFKNKVAPKFYQTGFYLTAKYKWPSILHSNVDVFDGMSGSPVFHYDGNDLKLVGILITKAIKKNCSAYFARRCDNVVLSLP